MQKEKNLRPSDPKSHSYELRIRHLEVVVQLLLAGTELPQFPFVSLAPLAGSLQYSKD
jgi:hypothetical protein